VRREAVGAAGVGVRVGPHGLFVDVRGARDSPALLYLHGGPGQGSYEFMAVQGDRLSKDLRIVGLDQRGVPRSTPIDERESLTIADLVEDCEVVRNALGVSHWCVLGQSFGGGLALRYAALHPESVSGLVFENPIWDVALSARAALPQIAELLAEGGQAADAAAARATVDSESAPVTDLWHAWVAALDALGEDRDAFFTPEPSARQYLQALRRSRRLTDTDQEQARHHRAVVADPSFSDSLLPLLDKLRAPALLLRGGLDPLTSREQVDAFLNAAAANHALVFERTGHFIQAEAPDLYRAIVTAFVQRC
jgi:proline iminopeptidase